jgi:NAD(P)-dependent dehydrogenase (short-subunit alcohol dehydrogenase family)
VAPFGNRHWHGPSSGYRKFVVESRVAGVRRQSQQRDFEAEHFAMVSTIADGSAGRLRGKAAIITGAARGIGRATAVAFARAGADVMGIDIAGPVSSTLDVVPATTDELAETGRLVGAAGARWCEARLDQRDLAALRAAAEKANATFGRLDILFANAGVQGFKAILDWDDADWHDTIDVNLTGTCNAIRAVTPYLVKNGGGRIIVTSSTQGRHGTKYGAAYSASKWGIIGLMKSAALEFGQYGITVNAVIPGLIDTALTRHHDRYAQAADDFKSNKPTAALEAEAKAKLIAKSPFGIPWIEPEAIAPIVVFLASDEAYMVSGATYDVTGGDSANYTA